MNPTDLSDATARALNLLPPGDPASSDPRLVRDPRLVEEARQSRETTAAVWLAVSPLRVAPPHVLNDVMKEIQSPEVMRRVTPHRSLPWLIASGWAAAAVVAFCLWPERLPTSSPRELVASPVVGPAEMPADAAPATPPTPRDARLRKDIARLQERLITLQNNPVRPTSRVLSLSAPGAVRRTEDESRQYVHKLLTDALRSALEATSGAPSDPASLVIERGWLPGGLPIPDDGGLIRHRNFPEKDWQELGLSRAANGNFYDAASQTVWGPDPEGRGFIGRKISEKDDVADFTQEPDKTATPVKPQAAPEGFVIENPAENRAEMFVENMPTVPEGKQLVVQFTNADGVKTETPLLPLETGGVASALSGSADTGLAHPSWFNRSSILGSVTLIGGDFTQFGVGKVVSNGVRTNHLSNPATVDSSPGVVSDSTQYSSNIVGYLNGGSLIVNFPNGTIPAEVQLALRDDSSAGQQDEIIVKSGP